MVYTIQYNELIFFRQQISTFRHWISIFRHTPLYFRHTPLFFRLCVMFAQGRQSHVSSVDAVTLRHAQNKLKHLAVHWANQTASDGVRQAHGIPPMERTQLSREQSECLFGPRAGIRVSGAGTPNTKIIISCTVCRGFTLWSRLFQNTIKHGVFGRSLWSWRTCCRGTWPARTTQEEVENQWAQGLDRS